MKNKKIYLLLICFFILNLCFFLQENNTIPNKQDDQGYINTVSTLSANVQIVDEWSRTWGGNYFDSGNAIALDSSDNIYIAGQTESFGAGSFDIFLVKYDGSGVQQWNRTWGGSADDYCYAIALDSSKNIYLTGSTYSFGAGSSDMCLVKLVEVSTKPSGPIILGYDLILLTSIICVILVILIKKRDKLYR